MLQCKIDITTKDKKARAGAIEYDELLFEQLHRLRRRLAGLRYDKGATSLYSAIGKSVFNCLMRCSVVSVIPVQRSTGAAEPSRNWSAANVASASRNAIHAR
jgi:hypothetical protein